MSYETSRFFAIGAKGRSDGLTITQSLKKTGLGRYDHDSRSEVRRGWIAMDEMLILRHIGKMQPVGDLAKDVTLATTLRRIESKAGIMRTDAERGTTARRDANEIRMLADIALRCLDG